MRPRIYLSTLLGGILIGAFLVVQDEILTVALYCGRTCLYPYPFIGALHLYDAEIVAFLGVLAGVALFTSAFMLGSAEWIMVVEGVLERRADRKARETSQEVTAS